MAHLWEADHPYYAAEGNYFDNSCHLDYDSWADFEDEEAGADIDYNLVYRWDWREGEDWEIPPGEAHFCVYFIGQRKALARSATVKVKREDEPAIIAYLLPRYQRIREIWAPFSDKEDIA